MTLQAIDPSKLSDRELLLILHERVFAMTVDVKDLKDGFSARLATSEARSELLELHKAERSEVTVSVEKLNARDDQQDRQLNRLTNYFWFAFGVIAVFQILLTIVMRYGFPH
jgi:hypothetical protein